MTEKKTRRHLKKQTQKESELDGGKPDSAFLYFRQRFFFFFFLFSAVAVAVLVVAAAADFGHGENRHYFQNMGFITEKPSR